MPNLVVAKDGEADASSGTGAAGQGPGGGEGAGTGDGGTGTGTGAPGRPGPAGSGPGSGGGSVQVDRAAGMGGPGTVRDCGGGEPGMGYGAGGQGLGVGYGTASGSGGGEGSGRGSGGGKGGSVMFGASMSKGANPGYYTFMELMENSVQRSLLEESGNPAKSYNSLARILQSMGVDKILASFPAERQKELASASPEQVAAEYVEDTALQWAGKQLKSEEGGQKLEVEDEVLRVLARTLQATQTADRLSQKLVKFIQDFADPAAHAGKDPV